MRPGGPIHCAAEQTESSCQVASMERGTSPPNPPWDPCSVAEGLKESESTANILGSQVGVPFWHHKCQVGVPFSATPNLALEVPKWDPKLALVMLNQNPNMARMLPNWDHNLALMVPKWAKMGPVLGTYAAKLQPQLGTCGAENCTATLAEWCQNGTPTWSHLVSLNAMLGSRFGTTSIKNRSYFHTICAKVGVQFWHHKCLIGVPLWHHKCQVQVPVWHHKCEVGVLFWHYKRHVGVPSWHHKCQVGVVFLATQAGMCASFKTVGCCCRSSPLVIHGGFGWRPFLSGGLENTCSHPPQLVLCVSGRVMTQHAHHVPQLSSILCHRQLCVVWSLVGRLVMKCAQGATVHSTGSNPAEGEVAQWKRQTSGKLGGGGGGGRSSFSLAPDPTPYRTPNLRQYGSKSLGPAMNFANWGYLRH